MATITPIPGTQGYTITGTNASENGSNTLEPPSLIVSATDVIYGLGGNDALNGGAGADKMYGGTGNDTYYVDNAGDLVSELSGEGTDTVSSSVAYTLSSNVENLILTGTANLNGTGNTLANTLTGNSGNNLIDGGGGGDTMVGMGGNDTYIVNNAGDVVTESANAGTDEVDSSVTYTLSANVEKLVLTGSADISGTGSTLSNTLIGNTGNNRLNDGGSGGSDILIGGTGDDSYVVNNAGDTVTESAGAGTDEVDSSITYTLSANVENLVLTGNASINGTGNTLANTITGNSGSNQLSDGGTGGSDVLLGGAGNDTYLVNNSGDTVTEASGAGTDTVQSSVTFSLGANIENLTLTGNTNISGTGNTLANTLTGNAGGNQLNDGGTGGSDTLIGGAGNDIYFVNNVGDTVLESASAGTDEIDSSVAYTLPTNVEKLVLTGSANINGTGNSTANTITGNSGNNQLSDGGIGGSDTLIGGAGNDTYIVNNSGDTVTEAASAGTDIVQSAATFTLGANIENLTLTGNASINGTGNTLANTITGNSSGNQLNDGGVGGSDTLIGGVGNDTYFVNNVGDTVTEAASAGADEVDSSVAYTLSANVENLVLTGSGNFNGTGNSLTNKITGNTGNNQLSDGGVGGSDILIGGAGNDTYIVNNVGDTVTEAASAGTDEVDSSVSYTLSVNVENLLLTGVGNINGTGNSLVNTLTGNSGNNQLSDGGIGGSDTLIGGIGNDTYIVNNSSDTVTEAASAGTDIVQSAVTFTLGANIENLTLTGGANINGTGNTLANTITGNGGNNQLSDGGAGGSDTLIGGAGNDTYFVNNAGDTVTESASAGTDEVDSSLASYTLPANVENLVLTGSGNINGTGNILVNKIAGNSGNNQLSDGGGGGSDTLIGGTGNDTYIVNNTGDIVTEAASAGTDEVDSSVNYTLATNVENLVLTGSGNINGTGNSLVNTITGNSGNNILSDGGTGGSDTLIGGDGNDTYAVNNTGDTVTETNVATTQIDLVQSSVTFTLGANLENLTLTGAGNINGTGNGLNNTLIGNNSNNLLDGSSGADAMSGGLGNDTFVIDNTGDSVSDTGGTDTVQSSITYVLGAILENLTLTGSANINGTGNILANTINGNSGNNQLSDGGAGNNDALSGGDGNDTYIVNNVGDTVTETNSSLTQIDLVQSSVSFTLGANLENLTLTGSASINGTGNALANTITGNGGNNILNDGGIGGSDTLVGGAGNDIYVVNNAGDTLTEATNGGIDTVQSSLSTYTLGANLENLTLTGNANISGTGNALANLINGNGGSNLLSDGGIGGSDTLTGGAGNDTYTINNAGDIVTESPNAGTDEVDSSVNFTLPTNVENLVLIAGSAAVNGTGNTLANSITGNGNNNLLSDGGIGGSDTLIGGDGNDTYNVYNLGDTVTESNVSTTQIDLVQSYVDFTLGANLENLTLMGSANINGTGNTLANTIVGNAGNNTLLGAEGNDILTGGIGADTLTGGNGNDTFVYIGSADTIIGSNDTITDFTSGTDKIDISQFDADTDPTNGIQQWTLTKTIGSTAPTFTGIAGEISYDQANHLLLFDQTGDTFADYQINLSNSPSSLALTDFSGIGLQKIFGSAGADTIVGGTGIDYLQGNGGADTLTGGTGADRFIYTKVSDAGLVASSAADTITDFSTAQGDKIDLTLLDADTNTSGTQQWGLVKMLNGTGGTSAFTGMVGEVTYDQTAHVLSFDQNGDGTADFQINLSNAPASLATTDFLGIDHQTTVGTASADTITGTSGNDYILGKDGADTLTGAGGNDRFIYTQTSDTGLVASSAADTITDFTSGLDKIDISKLDADTVTAGTQHWSLVSSFTGAGAEASFNTTTHVLSFDQAGVGTASQADFQITLTGLASLSVNDLVLF